MKTFLRWLFVAVIVGLLLGWIEWEQIEEAKEMEVKQAKSYYAKFRKVLLKTRILEEDP